MATIIDTETIYTDVPDFTISAVPASGVPELDTVIEVVLLAPEGGG